MLDETIEELTKQMIKNRFEDTEEKYIITKTELNQFCIKLIKTIREVKE